MKHSASSTIDAESITVTGNLGKKPKLLILDGVPHDLQQAADKYAALGYDVVTAVIYPHEAMVTEDGKPSQWGKEHNQHPYGIYSQAQLKTLLNAEKPDAVLSDNNWPNGCEIRNGAAMVQQVKKILPSIPCVVQSGLFAPSRAAVITQQGYATISKHDPACVLDEYLKEQFAAKTAGRGN